MVVLRGGGAFSYERKFPSTAPPPCTNTIQQHANAFQRARVQDNTSFKGSSLIKNSLPPWDQQRALGMFLL